MSKFKVGDKVWCNGDVRIIKRVDEWEDGEYGYYFNEDDDLLDFWVEEDLELYKTAHEKLLDLGFTFERKEHFIQYTHEKKDMRILVNTIMKKYGVFSSTNFDHKYRFVDLELSKILIQYLEELENEK